MCVCVLYVSLQSIFTMQCKMQADYYIIRFFSIINKHYSILKPTEVYAKQTVNHFFIAFRQNAFKYRISQNPRILLSFTQITLQPAKHYIFSAHFSYANTMLSKLIKTH